jgi:phosphoribosyl 1,2-cyclic phosphate phosphodiesterase
VKVEILGSGGATATPRPGCRCDVCVEAREKGVPFSRTGPSLFVHGPDIVFDTPEDARLQLDRLGTTRITACFYSHWHPDHTMGRRVWETRNGDFRAWPPEAKRPLVTDVYLPEQVAADFATFIGGRDHLDFLERRGWIRVREIGDRETVTIEGVEIRPFRLHEDYVYGFELRDGVKRLLVVMDELHDWEPPPELRGCDLVVLPMGICEHDPFTGERRIGPDHPILRFEATLPQTLEIARKLAPERIVLSHIEEIDGLSHTRLEDLAARFRADGLPVTFAWDGLQVEV